jgi:hypothetical protein
MKRSSAAGDEKKPIRAKVLAVFARGMRSTFR